MCVCITKPCLWPVSSNAYLGKGNPLRVPRCIPSGCPVPSLTHVVLSRRIRGVFGSRFEHQGQSGTGGNVWPLHRQPGEPPCSPGTPKANGRSHRPSGHPRPTVRRLDAAMLSRMETTKGAECRPLWNPRNHIPPKPAFTLQIQLRTAHLRYSLVLSRSSSFAMPAMSSSKLGASPMNMTSMSA